MKYRIRKGWDIVWGQLHIPQVQYWWLPFIWLDIGCGFGGESAAKAIIERHKEHKTEHETHTNI